jgi:hypothetical protein
MQINMLELLWIDERPLRKALEQELKKLSLELQRVEALIHDYFSRDLPQYQAWVSQNFASQLEEISQLEKKVKEMGAQVEETFQMSIELNVDPQKVFQECSAQGFYKNHQETSSETENSEEVADEPFLRTTTQKNCAEIEAKEIYRRIIRAIHPDLRGEGLIETEKDLWVRVQRAYAENDVYELRRLEEHLLSREEVPSLAYSGLLAQVDHLSEKIEKLRKEIIHLRSEKAWNFSQQKNIRLVEQELESEFQSTLKTLRQKQSYFSKTFDSWQVQDSKIKTHKKVSKRGSKQQASLFDE